MSNGRSHRRNIRAGKVRALLDQAEQAAPGAVIFGSGQGDGRLSQPVMVGTTMYVVPVPPAGASGPLLRAYSARATASVTGLCPSCGARRHLSGGHHATVSHDNDCPASDDQIVAALRAEGFHKSAATDEEGAA